MSWEFYRMSGASMWECEDAAEGGKTSMIITIIVYFSDFCQTDVRAPNCLPPPSAVRAGIREHEGKSVSDMRTHVWSDHRAQDVTMTDLSLISSVSAHLGGVADDYFRGDPVSDTVGIWEQTLEVAVRRCPLTHKQTAALCWCQKLGHIPVGETQKRGTSVQLNHTARMNLTVLRETFIICNWLQILLCGMFLLLLFLYWCRPMLNC